MSYWSAVVLTILGFLGFSTQSRTQPLLDDERNLTKIMIYQSFAPEQRVWRFIRYLGLGVESTDALLWLEW